MADWRADRIGSAHRGENPMSWRGCVVASQSLAIRSTYRGYSLLLSADSTADHLSDLDWEARREFLFDLSLIGEAIEVACCDSGLHRINYEVLGNSLHHLHGHVHPRYDWESPERITGPVWRYSMGERNAEEFAYSDERHGSIRAAVADVLLDLMRRAYG